MLKKLLFTLAALGGIIGTAFVFNTPPKEPLSIEEWQAIAAIYDYEIQKSGSLELKDVKSPKDIIGKLNSIITKREEAAKVEILGEIMEAEEYELLKRALIEKAGAFEKNALLKL